MIWKVILRWESDFKVPVLNWEVLIGLRFSSWIFLSLIHYDSYKNKYVVENSSLSQATILSSLVALGLIMEMQI